MELEEVVRRRRMVRSYDPDRAVDPDVLTRCLRLANRAPSAGHTQGREFLVLTDITSRERFWAATSSGAPDRWRERMARAPVLVVVYSDKNAYLDRYAEPDKGWSDRDEARWPIPYWHVDAGMAAMILLLAAEDSGLSACFFGVPPERWTALAEAFAVPDRLAPVGVISLGHAAPDLRSPSLRRGRRGLDDVVHHERFGASAQP